MDISSYRYYESLFIVAFGKETYHHYGSQVNQIMSQTLKHISHTPCFTPDEQNSKRKEQTAEKRQRQANLKQQ